MSGAPNSEMLMPSVAQLNPTCTPCRFNRTFHVVCGNVRVPKKKRHAPCLSSGSNSPFEQNPRGGCRWDRHYCVSLNISGWSMRSVVPRTPGRDESPPLLGGPTHHAARRLADPEEEKYPRFRLSANGLDTEAEKKASPSVGEIPDSMTARERRFSKAGPGRAFATVGCPFRRAIAYKSSGLIKNQQFEIPVIMTALIPGGVSQ
ncbi:unnamed protein product [Calicophoron daubneyi]|uniref:Uncharacterized protein n=1 Tax=Calicophoron daubneyi TaxID=300641 RepID=A0AAV2TE27_CALDB